MVATFGPAPYLYVCTRLRVRKKKLIPREEYVRMLHMGLNEIARLIGETEYKREIDELSHAFSGINLLEVALSWNLAKSYQNVLKILPPGLKEMTQSYLRRWDIQNVLTILRGKDQGMKPGKIKEVLIPAGEMDRAFLDRLVSMESSEEICPNLKGWRLYPVVEKEFPRSRELGSYARLENELYRQFYAEIIADARSGIKGGGEFLDYIRMDIDIRNLQNLLRIRIRGEKAELGEYMIPGGSVAVGELEELQKVEGREEFYDRLMRQLRNRALAGFVEGLKAAETEEEQRLLESGIALTRVQLAHMERMSKMHPFSIWPVLAYLELKKFEIFNLRAITRGKEAKLPMERIRNYLVM